jgi:hypothetical protein
MTPGGSFQGCCKSNPCSEKGCPASDLEPAQFKVTPTALHTPTSTATLTSNANTTTVIPTSNNVTVSHSNNTPIIVGVVVGGVVLIALIGSLFWYLRGRNRKDHNNKDPSSVAMMAENKIPDNGVNADNGKFSVHVFRS